MPATIHFKRTISFDFAESCDSTSGRSRNECTAETIVPRLVHGASLVGRRSVNALHVLILLLAVALPLAGAAQESEEPSAPESEVELDGSSDTDPDYEGDLDGSFADDPDPETELEEGLGSDPNIEEIIVEGARTQGFDREVTSSTTFGSSEIQNLRLQNVADLSNYTPNLEINTAFAASNPTLFIRGVGLKDYNSNSTGAVGIWHDNIMMNSPAGQLFSMYDVESIEVLRGPIGGIRGRNSTAGKIHLHSYKPTPEWTSAGSFTYGNFNNIEMDGAVGFPIFSKSLEDRLSGRISAVAQFRDPYTKNTCSDWDPEQFGLLTSSEEGIRDYYDRLEPSSTPVVTQAGSQYIYSNFEAVQEYNASGQGTINTGRLTDGTRVGIQSARFAIGPDQACLLDRAGDLGTFAGAAAGGDPEGTFTPKVNNTTPLSMFQGLKPYYNNIKYWGARGQLNFEATDTLSFLAKVHWGQNRGDSLHLQTIGAAPGRTPAQGEVITEPLGYNQQKVNAEFSEIEHDYAPFEVPVPREGLGPKGGSGAEAGFAGGDIDNGFYNSDGLEKLDLIGGNITANAEYNWGNVIGVVGYERSQRAIGDEADACPCSPLQATYDDEAWQATGEVLATIEHDKYTLKLDAFYLHEELESENIYSPRPRFDLEQFYTQTTDAFNVGADFHYDLTEEDWRRGIWQLSLDAGIRYNWERKDFTLGAAVRRLATDVVESTIPEENVLGTWQSPTGEIVLSYLPVEDVRIYTKYTHGYKAGHFNAGLTVQSANRTLNVQQSLDPVDPEQIDAVEIGFRSTWLDSRVEFSGALFRYWYTDLQVFDIVNEAEQQPTQQLLNADADVLGAELEATVRPLDGLLLQTGFGWLDSKFGEFLVQKQVTPSRGRPPTPGNTAVFNYEGNPLIAAPQFSWSGYAEYELPLNRWGSVIPSFDYSFKSRAYLDPQQELLMSQPSYWLLGARLAYRIPNGSMEVAVWVENFLDQRYRTDAFDLSRQFQMIQEVWSEPRTFGVTISYAF
jgi:outer membrane receptor protein involved in Fe transport